MKPPDVSPKPAAPASAETRNSGATAPDASGAEPSRICPNCGAPLFEQKCKLLCPNRACGYYLSCSDFY